MPKNALTQPIVLNAPNTNSLLFTKTLLMNFALLSLSGCMHPPAPLNTEPDTQTVVNLPSTFKDLPNTAENSQFTSITPKLAPQFNDTEQTVSWQYLTRDLRNNDTDSQRFFSLNEVTQTKHSHFLMYRFFENQLAYKTQISQHGALTTLTTHANNLCAHQVAKVYANITLDVIAHHVTLQAYEQATNMLMHTAACEIYKAKIQAFIDLQAPQNANHSARQNHIS